MAQKDTAAGIQIGEQLLRYLVAADVTETGQVQRRRSAELETGIRGHESREPARQPDTVSYTHLDVYKRQLLKTTSVTIASAT